MKWEEHAMNKTFSAYIEYHGKYTAALRLFERFKGKFDSLQGEGGVQFCYQDR